MAPIPIRGKTGRDGPNRRTFLLLTGSVLSLSGCVGSENPKQGTTPAPTDSPTKTSTSEPTPSTTTKPTTTSTETPEPTTTSTETSEPTPTETPTPNETSTTPTETTTTGPEWLEIGEAYEGANGLTVTLHSFDIQEKTGSFQYRIEYTLKNGTDSAKDEGAFKLYGDEGLNQYGLFDKLFPGDETTRSYTFEAEKDVTFRVLSYHPDQFLAQSPPNDALTWPVEY